MYLIRQWDSVSVAHAGKQILWIFADVQPENPPPHLWSCLSGQMPICSENVCIGSVMIPNTHTRKPDEVRSPEELLPLATDFIDQYYTSIKRQARPAAVCPYCGRAI